MTNNYPNLGLNFFNRLCLGLADPNPT